MMLNSAGLPGWGSVLAFGVLFLIFMEYSGGRAGEVKMKYIFNQKAAPWNTAERICKKNGGTLVKLNTKEKFALLMEYLAMICGNSCQDQWIGMFDSNPPDQKYAWTDCCFTSPSDSLIWTAGEPNLPYDERCVRLSYGQKGFKTRGCNREFPFICETDGCSWDIICDTSFSSSTDVLAYSKMSIGECIDECNRLQSPQQCHGIAFSSSSCQLWKISDGSQLTDPVTVKADGFISIIRRCNVNYKTIDTTDAADFDKDPKPQCDGKYLNCTPNSYSTPHLSLTEEEVRAYCYSVTSTANSDVSKRTATRSDIEDVTGTTNLESSPETKATSYTAGHTTSEMSTATIDIHLDTTMISQLTNSLVWPTVSLSARPFGTSTNAKILPVLCSSSGRQPISQTEFQTHSSSSGYLLVDSSVTRVDDQWSQNSNTLKNSDSRETVTEHVDSTVTEQFATLSLFQSKVVVTAESEAQQLLSSFSTANTSEYAATVSLRTTMATDEITSLEYYVTVSTQSTSHTAEATTGTTIKSSKELVCICKCKTVAQTTAEATRNAEVMKKTLLVKTSTLSKQRRQLTTATDVRPTAVACGTFGIAVLIITLTVVVASDFTHIWHAFQRNEN